MVGYFNRPKVQNHRMDRPTRVRLLNEGGPSCGQGTYNLGRHRPGPGCPGRIDTVHHLGHLLELLAGVLPGIRVFFQDVLKRLTRICLGRGHCPNWWSRVGIAWHGGLRMRDGASSQKVFPKEDFQIDLHCLLRQFPSDPSSYDGSATASCSAAAIGIMARLVQLLALMQAQGSASVRSVFPKRRWIRSASGATRLLDLAQALQPVHRCWSFAGILGGSR